MKQGIQLYTVRDYIQNYDDADKTFEFIKDFGCDTVQISGIGPIEPENVKQLIDKYGFDVCVTHKPFERMINDLTALVEEHKMINCDMIGIGSMPGEYREDADKVKEFCRIVNDIGKKMHSMGVHLAYHNHDFEFKPLDNGKNLMDIILEETDPEYFKLIPDVAWLQYSGNDPCEFLEKNVSRIKVVHMKDFTVTDGNRKFVEFGKGLVDFDKVYKVCAELGIPYAVYEQDSDWAVNALDSCEYSFKKMLETEALLTK